MNQKPKTFAKRIEEFNRMYKLPVSYVPAAQVDLYSRLSKFKIILTNEVEEVEEIKDCIAAYDQDKAAQLETLVMLADWLGDIIVYCRSEAMRNGIPLEEVIDIIMDSNASKLGADGEPIYDPETGKVMKGPHYWKPEPKISELLASRMME